MVDAGKTEGRESDRCGKSKLIAMLQRERYKLFCVAACVLVVILCAISQAPILAMAHSVAAVVVWRVDFGRKVESRKLDAFVSELQDASYDDEHRDAPALATVWPSVICAPIRPLKNRALLRMSIVFRDEFSPSQWRVLATRLRHQPRAALRSRETR